MKKYILHYALFANNVMNAMTVSQHNIFHNLANFSSSWPRFTLGECFRVEHVL